MNEMDKRTTWDSSEVQRERKGDGMRSCHSQRNLLAELIYKTEFFCRSMRTRQQLELMRQSNWKRVLFLFFPSLSRVHVSTFLGAFHFLNICHHTPSKYNLMSTSVRQLPQVVQFHPRRAEAQWRSQRSQKGNTVIWSWWVSSWRFTKICDNVIILSEPLLESLKVGSALKLNLYNNLLPFLTCVTGIILIKLLERIEWGRFTQTLWNERLLGN